LVGKKRESIVVMANAAAKKALIAREVASSFYLPFIIIVNMVHILLNYYYLQSSIVNVWSIVQWIGTYFAFKGILDDATDNFSQNFRNKRLAGGIYLDLLALIMFTQYASLLLSQKINWLLVIAPIGYGIQKFYLGTNDNSETTANDGSDSKDVMSSEAKEALMERRKKRAERRRQKRF